MVVEVRREICRKGEVGEGRRRKGKVGEDRGIVRECTEMCSNV